jgi:acyl-coenzyme A thioesterase PaaI-like protein
MPSSSRAFILKLLFICAVAAVAAPTIASAQATGRVSGRVVDQTGGVLPGVTIDLVVRGIEQTQTTDGEGRFRFDAVSPGDAELTFRLLNFTVVRRIVSVHAGSAIAADVVMTLALNADVVVTGTRTFRNIAEVENPAENLVGSHPRRARARSRLRSSRSVRSCARAKCSRPFQAS